MQIIVSGTDLGALYKATNNVLKKYGEESKFTVPEKIKGQSVMSVFKNLFNSSSFSICEVRELAELHQVEISNEHMNWMRTLHCVKFTDMHSDTKEYLFAVLVEYFKPIISMSYVAN